MAPAFPEIPTDRAGFLLSRVGTAVQSGFKDVLAGWDVRPLHFLVLSALGSRSGSSQQDLCRLLGIDSGNMVELLDVLETRGYARTGARCPRPPSTCGVDHAERANNSRSDRQSRRQI